MAMYKANQGHPRVADGAAPWEAQLRKGCLEMAILASLVEGKRYGLEILRSLDGAANLALAEGTLYLILNRLKSEGLVQSEWVDAGTGHPRKYYWLTETGRGRLTSMARFWSEFSTNLDVLLKPLRTKKEDTRGRE